MHHVIHSDMQAFITLFAQELFEDDPLNVIRRVESGRFALNEACVKLYIKVPTKMNKLFIKIDFSFLWIIIIDALMWTGAC